VTEILKILLGIVGLLLTVCAQTRAPTVAIRNVTVVDVIKGVLRADHTVLVAGNRIVAVGPADDVRIAAMTASIESLILNLMEWDGRNAPTRKQWMHGVHPVQILSKASRLGGRD